MSEHRVAMLGASWRRLEDPTRSRDPRVLAVVGALATLPRPEPRPAFRAELRAQLVAITPRLVAEGSADASTMVEIVPRPSPRPAPVPAAHADGFLARLPRLHLGRPLTVAASVIVAFALLLGGAVWMSRKALPGDTLYGLKRASEQVQLATAGSATAKAHDYLDFAATRVQEVRELLQRAGTSAEGRGPQAAGGVDANTAQLIASNLSSADSDVKSATSLLGKQAIAQKSAAPLDTLTKWAPGQLARLRAVNAAMPSASLQQRVDSSSNLVATAVQRVTALAPDLGCSCLSDADSDSLGPVPCGQCVRPATGPSPSQQPAARSSAASSGAPGGTQQTSGGTNAQQSTAAPSGNGSGTSSGSPTPGLQLPSLNLPTLNLPLPTPTLPVKADSCGVGAALGPLGIAVGLCPLGVTVGNNHS